MRHFVVSSIAVALTASGVCRTVKRGIGPVAGAKIVG